MRPAIPCDHTHICTTISLEKDKIHILFIILLLLYFSKARSHTQYNSILLNPQTIMFNTQSLYARKHIVKPIFYMLKQVNARRSLYNNKMIMWRNKFYWIHVTIEEYDALLSILPLPRVSVNWRSVKISAMLSASTDDDPLLLLSDVNKNWRRPGTKKG